MWFTETAWPPIVLFLCGAIVLGVLWSGAQRTGYLVGAVGLVLASVVAWMIEGAVVTDREQVEDATTDIVRQFQLNHPQETLAYVSESPQAIPLRMLVTTALDAVDVAPDVHVTDVQVRLLSEGTRAQSHFRVNGTVSLKNRGSVGHHPFRFQSTWQKENGGWKMLSIEDLDPITGKTLNRFNSMEGGQIPGL
jgi:hypothetical protein